MTQSQPELVSEPDISECYIPDDEFDPELMGSPSSGIRPEKSDIAMFSTPENRKFLQKIFRKLNYKNCEDVLFSSYIKLYSFVDETWKFRGIGWLKIVRQLRDGPCRGSCRLVVYERVTMCTLVEHFLEEEMKAELYNGRGNAVIWGTSVSIVGGGNVFAAIFPRSNGSEIVRDFLSSYEKGKKLTALTRLGINECDLRVVDKASLVLTSADDRPHIQKRRRLSVE